MSQPLMRFANDAFLLMRFRRKCFPHTLPFRSVFSVLAKTLENTYRYAMGDYNPPINYRAISLATLRHVLDSYHAITPV